ncbi:hypothetical protein PMIN02_002118 [Paraphaeosphaeria minitans]|uniref:RNA recognition motif-containing protein n=1 Tax=Paraphaeosphaeria minitans TaxID=565426 RepID=A0A9P6GHV7_9PLEO|nr:RNA recognition motif-containing protein [Paraphaeosphaeria minitans]
MPPQPGEVSLLTLFADIHYYLSPPSHMTPHHRFDKGSYVYLYHNPMQHAGRIEIANHAGTPDQDAFAGHLDTVRIEQTYKHPCLFTLSVDAFRSQNGSATSSPQQDVSQWHLPCPDPQNNGKYMYRLHTVDIYFWTPEDASLFLDSMRRVVQPHQLQILANPQAAPAQPEYKNDAMNPVVAKLERAAISHPSRSPSLNLSTHQSFPGPPSAPAPTSSPPAADAHGNFAPMAYNPAAPAAPEPIAHREKTPPPPDAADGTGLNAAAYNDHHHAQQYGNPLQTSFAPQSTSGAYVPGPPSRTSTFSGPPQPPGVSRTNTVESIPPPPQSPPSFAPPPAGPVQQFANHAGSPGFAPGVQSPGAPSQSPLPSPGLGPQQYQPMASPPAGGYAQYQYGSTSPQQQAGAEAYGMHPQIAGAETYGMHQQLYRPTEQEAQTKYHTAPGTQAKSNIGKRAEKFEKGIGGFLKKLDKKF